MEFSLDFQPVYPRHDLLVEMGWVEMAMERLQARDDRESQVLRPRLATRLQKLQLALRDLPA